MKNSTSLQPVIYYEGHYTNDEIENFKKSHQVWKVHDIFQSQLEELFEIQNPNLVGSSAYQQQLQTYIAERVSSTSQGNWIYLPWSGVLIHTVNQTEYDNLRTNRNQLLITQEEQKLLAKECVGFAGLSIGSHFVTSLVYSGIASQIKIADLDYLSTTNLNRVRAKIDDIGKSKVEIVSEQVYEINPYQQLEVYEKGLNQENLSNFLTQGQKPRVVFEAVDDFRLKIELRLKAREQRIPIIMVTNLGDNILVDIERYDVDDQLPLFNGLIGNTPEEILQQPITELDKIKYAIKIVSPEYTPTRALATLQQINKTLVGRPQLYSTVSAAGGVAAYIAKKLILSPSELHSGRYQVMFSSLFKLNDEQDETVRDELLKDLFQRVGM